MEIENADIRRRESSRRIMKPADGGVSPELELLPPGTAISSFVVPKPSVGAVEVEGSSSWISGTAHLVTVIIGAGKYSTARQVDSGSAIR